MKLYRGIKAKEFSHFTPKTPDQLRTTWEAVLTERAGGDFSYPDDLNDDILEASKLVRLQRQHFTDNKKIAFSYAQENDGVLIEIDVSVPDILDHFTIEFQKFAQRKKNFEIVYVVNATDLHSFSKKWKIKMTPLKCENF